MIGWDVEKRSGDGGEMKGPKPELNPAASSEFSKIVNNFALPLVG